MKETITGVVSWIKKWYNYSYVKDTITFTFFLFVSICFWFLYNLNDDFEVKVYVPVTLTDVPDDVLITTPLPPHVLATISGKGTALLRYQTDNTPPINIDFALYDKGTPTGHSRIPMTDVRMLLEKQLASGVRLGEVIADTMEFYYNRGISRRLPVRNQGHISTTAHNYIRSMRFKPDSIEVFASQDVLDTMRYAYTQQFSYTDLNRSETFNVGFMQQKGVYYKPNQVQLLLDIDFYTEKSIRVPVREVNFPAGLALRTFPNEVLVTFRIGASKYNSVTPQDFLILVSYEELLQNDHPKIRLHLKTSPEGISNVRIHPQEVDYLIERLEN